LFEEILIDTECSMKKYPYNFNDMRMKLEVDSKTVTIKCCNKEKEIEEFEIEFS